MTTAVLRLDDAVAHAVPVQPPRYKEPVDRAPERIGVAIADDHPATRTGLRLVIEADPRLEVVGEAQDGEAGLELILRSRPAVALLDARMPRLDGVQVLRALEEEAPTTRVILISGYVDSAYVHEALAAGAAGFLSKDSSAEDICAAIVEVAGGGVALSPELQAGLFEEVRQAARPGPDLSAREREILSCAAQGDSVAQIAARLNLGTTTVKTYLQRAYGKLGVNSRAAAIAEAIRRGALD